MASYTHLTIVNGTTYDFVRGSHHSYQMDDWDTAFPEYIPSGRIARVQIRFQNPPFGSKYDDGAEQVYELNNGRGRLMGQLALEARVPSSGYHLQLATGGLVVPGGPVYATIPIGFKEDSEGYLWISGNQNGYVFKAFWP